MNSSGDRLAGAAHNDVLNVDPKTDDERARLVDEIKRRGNAAFKVRSLPEAITLYSRAIELAPMTVALWGNRSMAQAKMGKFKEALTDAEKCIVLDPSWAKGYYRKAQACSGLEDFDSAQNSYEKVLELDPKNKAALKELETVKLKKKKQLEAPKPTESDEPKKVFVSKKIVTDKGKNKEGNSSKKKAKDVDLSLRGYRTLPDGRKTTFFNMQRTEEELKLIGENKPQKLDDAAVAQNSSTKQGSAWNEGGTFEEVDLNSWATKNLHELVENVKCDISTNGKNVTLKVKSLSDLEGDASKTFTRGEQRKIFDFNFNVEWTAECKSEEGKSLTVSGTLFYPDFSGDVAASGDSFECELRWSRREMAGEFESLIRDSVKGESSALQKAIDSALREW
eukprot:CAMPEP_0184057032 /NCGR_PEP_ID=MMETSP0956-20121227/8182_1 /TAXON_ID=627963 /ORGANISM="Aplanochytrium sp, Strain PBS07" /LENGTH=393 /DNA_ID=CAMNT_0026351273 /DNA_START=151 /DNA_END=1329 /DNA_ORIENTATION=-